MESFHEICDVDVVGKSTANEYFDEIIGHIEDIIISDEFVALHSNFLETHWSKFHNTEENKIECMHIFQNYTRIFEDFLASELSRRMSNFNMQKFAEHLDKNEAFDDTTNYGEINELLHSFFSFQIFKELMLNYRLKKEGLMQHLDLNILTTKSITK